MRWQMGRRSSNIEDRRGSGPRLGRGGGPRLGVPIRLPGGRAGGLGGVGLIAVVLIALFLGVDPGVLLQGGGQVAPDDPGYRGEASFTPEEERLKEFVSVVLADTEDSWNGMFATMGEDYAEPTLVLFSGAVQSACGFAQAASGPFYCPGDHQLYLDMSFFDELERRFGAPGDFAQAYVIAHEVGHHVQTLLGITQEVRRYQQEAGGAEANEASVMLELQADCLAGIWANQADELLEPGDLDEGLRAASAIGDDRLQRQSGGVVNPDSFTHGSSEQRVRWFRTGLETGDVEACNTFGAARL
jgi:uncharacterized protein